jgi:triphosphoribosyl-dephospho-CoA synthase
MSEQAAAIAKLSIGQCATLACLLEATAPKVGNVHRGADFHDLSFTDFTVAGVAIGPAMEDAQVSGVGRAVLSAIEATRGLVETNVNLGIALLLAPLAAVPREQDLASGVKQVLAGLSAEDCRLVYEAIRLAKPGGMGEVEEMDVAEAPPENLLDAMRVAADRDLIARQYVTDFELVLGDVLPRLVAGQQRGWSLTTSILRTHLELLAQYGDSLIARKCGDETAKRVAVMAQQVLDAGGPDDENYHAAMSDFDFWLRSDGNRRNPGTTADLIAAALFAGLRDRQLVPPLR